VSPTRLTVRLTAMQEQWTEEQTEHNVYRYRRGPAEILVSYTFGGQVNISAVHYRRGTETFWLHNKTPGKRKALLELLQRG
jgi:hypothetical protein